MSKNNEKWYHSFGFDAIGMGLGLALVMGGCGKGCQYADPQGHYARIEMAKYEAMKNNPAIYHLNVAGNETLDKIAVFKDENNAPIISLIEVDGVPVVKKEAINKAIKEASKNLDKILE